MDKTHNNRAWFLVLPMLVVVAFSAVIPLMTVVNYAVNDTFGQQRVLLGRPRLVRRHAPLRPPVGRARPPGALLGHHPRDRGAARHLRRAQHAEEGLLGLLLPRRSWRCRCSSPSTSSAPSGRSSAAPTSASSAARSPALGIDYNYTNDPIDAWITIIVMDVWHWTSLVALLCYAALQSIPAGLLPGGARSTRRAAGRSSATSSCRR